MTCYQATTCSGIAFNFSPPKHTQTICCFAICALRFRLRHAPCRVYLPFPLRQDHPTDFLCRRNRLIFPRGGVQADSPSRAAIIPPRTQGSRHPKTTLTVTINQARSRRNSGGGASCAEHAPDVNLKLRSSCSCPEGGEGCHGDGESQTTRAAEPPL